MTPEIIQSKRHRRYLESVWRKSRSTLDRSRYTRQYHLCNRQMSKAKWYYNENMVSNNSATPKQLWKCIHQILHRRPAPSLPTHAAIKSLYKSFSNNFKDTISLRHPTFTDHTPNTVNVDSPQVNTQLASFEPATTAEVIKIIMSSRSKYCDGKNVSLRSGLFPEDFKCAHANKIFKKTTLPKEELNSNRPISNHSVILKILEKVIANRIRSHICINGLSNMLQSANKQFHSTETALLKLHNDTNLNIDNGKVTAMTLLDLSAAFDTIDHDILNTRLSTWYGISRIAMSWFTSYITDRRKAIKIGNCFSVMLPTSCGVPQGSVLGPLLFTLYTAPLRSVIQSHNMDRHLYADDTHMYFSLTTPDTYRSLDQPRDCLQDVSLWMKNSKLKLNEDKTEFLIIGTSTQRAKLDGFFRHITGVRTSHHPPQFYISE